MRTFFLFGILTSAVMGQATDPAILPWLTGSNSNSIQALGADASGNVVAAGGTSASFSPVLVHSHVFIGKLSPDRRVLWGTFFGGSASDTLVALALDPQGNSYVTGKTDSIDFPQTGPPLAGAHNAFVAKLDPDGALLYSTLFDGDVTGLAVSAAGEVFITGRASGSDGFLSKFDASGAIVASMTLPEFSPVRERKPWEARAMPRSKVAVAQEAGTGAVFVGGASGSLARASADFTSLEMLTPQGGEISAMTTGPNGDL